VKTKSLSDKFFRLDLCIFLTLPQWDTKQMQQKPFLNFRPAHARASRQQ
jgi:hypothetical protein